MTASGDKHNIYYSIINSAKLDTDCHLSRSQEKRKIQHNEHML